MFKSLLKLSVITLSLHISAVYSAPDYWAKSNYAIECHNMGSLKDVLEDFSSSFGVSLKMSEGVSGSCSGWLRSDTALGFLDKLANDYKFQWFVYQNSLYVSSAKASATARITTDHGFKDTLIGLGLFKEKFGWGEVPGDKAVIVTGPKSYIDIIKRLTRQHNKVKKRQVSGNVHVFKLEHAPVSDRSVPVRDGEVNIPGVATILQGLFSGQKRIGYDVPKKDGFNADSNLSKISNKDDISVTADVRTNTILIRAPEEDYDFYRDIIDSLDVPSALIEIDAVIVDINRDDLKEIGTDFSFIDDRDRGGFQTSTSLDSAQSPSANASATILIKDLGLFHANLKALESRGEASIIANTSILTLENQPAVIDLSETVFIQSVGERVIDVKPVSAGTLLNVTPMFVTDNGIEKIKLLVDIEDGTLISGRGVDTPRISRTTINTKAVIDQERSLVIGGYHLQKRERENRGIPLLKSVPALGRLFSTTVERDSNLERLFILTPRISPTFHNPEDYSSTGNADAIASSIEKMKRRWRRASESYIEKTSFIFSELAARSTPKGYELHRQKKEPASFSCLQEGVDFSFTNGERVNGHGLTAFVGVVLNLSDEELHIDERSCFGEGLIGVSIYPRSTLAKGKKSVVFVSMESARMNKNKSGKKL